jgi:isoleucyl-tRNA synthetase
MEEAWTTRFGADESVHLQLFLETPAEWANPPLLEKWSRLRDLRRVVTGALEVERAAKVIGASLEAKPTLYVDAKEDAALFEHVSLAEIAITSGADIVIGAAPPNAFRLADAKGAAVVFKPAEGHKCARCWMILPEVGTNPEHSELCRRCSEAVGPTR